MNVVAIDTHEVVKEPEVAGFGEDQAEAATHGVRRARGIGPSVLTHAPKP